MQTSVKYLGVAASLASVAEAQLPVQFAMTLGNHMPQVSATFETQAIDAINISNNADTTVLFGNTCFQKLDLTTGATNDCSEYPTYTK